MFYLAKFYWKEAIAYRAQMFFTVINTPLRFFVLVFIWSALYEMNGIDKIQGFSLSMLISYFMINTFLTIFTYDDVHQFLEDKIRHGNFVVYMLKPVSVVWLQFIKKIAVRAFAMIVEILPVLGIFLIFFTDYFVLGAVFPFMISALFAFIIAYLIFLIVGTLAFWFVNIRSFSWLVSLGIQFASGMLLPLDLFPQTAQRILAYLPFQYMSYTPTMIYLGRIDDLITAFLMQGFWILFLGILAAFLWRMAIKRFSGVGA
ncbi:MAG: ABC-2 family transporter protein [Candidatus Woesearchaeota archaeon]